MQIQKSIAVVEMILLAVGLSAVGSAQGLAGGKKPFGDLGHDLVPGVDVGGHGQAQRYDGPVLDAGSVFVDIGQDEALSLSFETWTIPTDPRGIRPPRLQPRLRLAGGTPGNAGAVLVSLAAPAPGTKDLAASAAAIHGVFGDAGSFLVDLPELGGEFFVQGIEVTAIGGVRSGVRRLVPPGHLVDPSPSFGGAQAISDAVERATRKQGVVYQRFVGAARMAGVQGAADVGVVLGKTVVEGKDSYSMHLGPALALRTALAEPGSDGATFHFQSAAELSGAIEAVITLDAFADLDLQLEWARADLFARRVQPGMHLPRCGTQPTGDGGAQVGDATALTDEPLRAGDKVSLPQRKAGGARRSTGALGDGGTMSATLAMDGVVSGFETLTRLAEPRRAMDKDPLPTTQATGSGRYTGAIGDAGSFEVNLPPALAQDLAKARRTVETLESVARQVDLLRDGLQHSGGHGSPR